ncbi:hypothetical protein, partial [Paenibacillus sp. E194]|uniref:hypothetical protein n=1 Tax=Paenibacillus sp. E194 TaxID=1458845 RepID=UPI0018CE038F
PGAGVGASHRRAGWFAPVLAPWRGRQRMPACCAAVGTSGVRPPERCAVRGAPARRACAVRYADGAMAAPYTHVVQRIIEGDAFR